MQQREGVESGQGKLNKEEKRVTCIQREGGIVGERGSHGRASEQLAVFAVLWSFDSFFILQTLIHNIHLYLYV